MSESTATVGRCSWPPQGGLNRLAAVGRYCEFLPEIDRNCG